jgi:hypothetical protein
VVVGPVSKMALQQKKAFCVLHFEVSRSVITVKPHHSFVYTLYRNMFPVTPLCVLSQFL